MRGSQMLLLFFSAVLASCSSAGFSCDPAAAPHAPRNFGRVTASVYRGGQPATCSELAFLSASGVKTVLKLNDRHSASDEEEKAEGAKLGLRVESFRFDPRTIGRQSTCGDVRRALAVLQDESNWPVYVHCTAGKDRTGYIIGLYERTALRRPIAEVMKELRDYGHRGARSTVMPQIDEELRRETPQCAQD